MSPHTPLLYIKTGVCSGIPIFSSPEPKAKFGNIGFYMGKSENYGFFENYCSLRPEKW